MTYFVKRDTVQEIPFDRSEGILLYEGTGTSSAPAVYDIITSPKNTGLESIADFIIETNGSEHVLVKSIPGQKDTFTRLYEQQTGETLQELLLG